MVNPIMHGSSSNHEQEGLETQSSQTRDYINIDAVENGNETNNQSVNGNANVEVNTQNPRGEGGVALKRKRQKSSTVWEDFIEVTLPDGKEKVECVHCKKQLTKNPSGTTTTYGRHAEKCLKRAQFLRTQQLLNFQPVDVEMGCNKPPSLIGIDGKYDANKMRESMVHWLLATEQPFSTVDIPDKSELQMYLEEGVLTVQCHGGIKFSVLDWWNTHKLKYRILSKMAIDILAVPISTVASESTFSASGRVIEPYRSTLAPTTVEMLICGGDWIRQLYGVKKKLKKDDTPNEVLLPSVKDN